jgi:hypothetical protein
MVWRGFIPRKLSGFHFEEYFMAKKNKLAKRAEDLKAAVNELVSAIVAPARKTARKARKTTAKTKRTAKSTARKAKRTAKAAVRKTKKAAKKAAGKGRKASR